jgi:hypothetical protein
LNFILNNGKALADSSATGSRERFAKLGERSILDDEVNQ